MLQTTELILYNVVYRVMYTKGIKYINLIENALVVIEICDLAVPVNNTLVCHMSFLAIDK